MFVCAGYNDNSLNGRSVAGWLAGWPAPKAAPGRRKAGSPSPIPLAIVPRPVLVMLCVYNTTLCAGQMGERQAQCARLTCTPGHTCSISMLCVLLARRPSERRETEPRSGTALSITIIFAPYHLRLVSPHIISSTQLLPSPLVYYNASSRLGKTSTSIHALCEQHTHLLIKSIPLSVVFTPATPFRRFRVATSIYSCPDLDGSGSLRDIVR